MTRKEDNARRYLHPPTIAEMVSFIKDTGVSMRKFEQFFGIPADTLKKVKAGKRELPVAYWHIFYEKLIPTYGSVYKDEQFPDTETMGAKEGANSHNYLQNNTLEAPEETPLEDRSEDINEIINDPLFAKLFNKNK